MKDDPAKARFLVINLVRLTGVAMILVGVLATQKRIELPDAAAYLLIVLGLLEVFVFPRLLARRWRSPE